MDLNIPRSNFAYVMEGSSLTEHVPAVHLLATKETLTLSTQTVNFYFSRPVIFDSRCVTDFL